MDIVNFSNLESQVLSLFNEGNKTFDSLLEASPITEKTLNSILEGLISKNILKLNPTKHEYEYQSKVNGDIIILDGNILLPTTVIKMKDKILVCRGEWYEFPIDFDIRRIIWNVKLENKTNSTLVDLIKTSILKVKKSRIVQLPEYENLKNKIVPYSKSLGLLLNTIGEEVTDVTIIFKIPIIANSEITPEHRGFTVNTEISTEELLTQLKLPVNERSYETGIKLNRIYNFSDFIFSKNEIPVSFSTTNELTFVKISGIRKTFELSYMSINSLGHVKKLDIESFDDANEGIEKLRDIFKGLPSLILSQNNFISELTE
jgi:hypothetical protein